MLASLLLAQAAHAQFTLDFGLGSGDDAASGDPVELTAAIEPGAANAPPRLVLTAKIDPGWHVYSITQPTGGPQRTVIQVEPSDQFRLADEFDATPAYDVHFEEAIWPGVEIQEHSGQVTWSAPIEPAPGVPAETVAIRGVVRLQACNEACVPLELPFEVNAGKARAAATLSTATPQPPTADAVAPIGDGGVAGTTEDPELSAAYDLEKVSFSK
ncbi:MAG: protein-disulfide reductase DsbD domain-containing protein, partial [Planctomycetota bacterium]